MPDSRLSINALVHGPLPTRSSGSTSPTSSSNSPSPSTNSPTTLSYVTWEGSRNTPPRDLPSLPPITAPTPPSPPTPPTPTSPQTVIVKTPRGKRHRCTFQGCGRDFTRLSNLKAHWRRHSGEEPYACMHCTRKFKWRSSLKSHELGCVYEFTKASSVRWVYVSTDQEKGLGGIRKPVLEDCARRQEFPLGMNSQPLVPSGVLGAVESRSYA